MDEEKKTSGKTPSSASSKEESVESDFSDEAKPIVPAEPVKVEKPVEPVVPSIDLHVDKVEENKSETSAENPNEKAKEAKAKVETYQYDDPDLSGIENERLAFYAVYKKSNVIKWIVTAVCLVLIIAGWIVPSMIPALADNSSVSFYITIGVVLVSLVVLLVFMSVYKKKVDAAMKIYFNRYYSYTNHFVFGDKVQNVTGGIDNKLDPALFGKAHLYKDVYKVGSRECLTFTYRNHHVVEADAAAQIKGQKTLQTVFVGKFISTDNAYTGPEIIIYFKGNKRALPPTNLDGRNVLEDSRTMVVYADSDAKRFFTHPVREALAAFDTNATFVDMAISVEPGLTSIAMGYEDNLMVLPLEKPFNPAPTRQLQSDLVKVFALLDAIDGPKKHD